MFKNRKIFLLFSFLLLIGSLFLVKSTLAADDALGIEAVEDGGLVLKAVDPRAIAVKIINIFLGILGVVAVSLIIYGGALWMTSEGNEERISKAKNVLKSAAIGLAIVLAAWGIVTFVFKYLFPSEALVNDIPPNNNAYIQTGLGAMGNCTLESVYPGSGQRAVPRNTTIIVSFKEVVSTSSFNVDTIAICQESDFDFIANTCSSSVNFTSATNDEKVFVITPNSYLGNENGFSDYVVYLSEDILKKDESASIFSTCQPNHFLWNFEVSNLLDLTPPKIESIFPQFDNESDGVSTSSILAYATASFEIVDQPITYQAASVISSTTGEGTSATTTINLGSNYNGQYTHFNIVTTEADYNSSPDIVRVQLRGGNSSNLGSMSSIGVFEVNDNEVNFPNYFRLRFNSNVSSGNSWNIEVKKRVLADTITVGNYVYTFIDGDTAGYNIKSSDNSSNVAEQIAIALNSHPNVIASSVTAIVSLEAKVGGVGGNNIIVASSDISKINFTPFSGGVDRVENIIVNGKKDKPMNSIIQINFNEVVNPLMVSGESEEVADKIRIINNATDSKGEGQSCEINNDCLSFKCQQTEGQIQKVCSGDYLSGEFLISSNYKTVEFKSNNKCGVNGCGEDIFCLPPTANIGVELVAANLFNCEGSSENCSNKIPFSECSSANICVNSENKRYPLSNMSAMDGIMDAMDGIMDAAANSLDGNSNNYSYGPESVYDKNNPNANTGDSFRWSFWTSNKIETAPPVIESINPSINASSADVYLPVVINFDKLMMGSTLKTGQTKIGDNTHRLINLISGQLVGYWTSSDNKDISPVDGEPDKTTAYINHADFFELADYTAQAGSGVRDIYQNCFKPSAGPGEGQNTLCEPTALLPFCCNGVASSSCIVL